MYEKVKYGWMGEGAGEDAVGSTPYRPTLDEIQVWWVLP